MNWHKHKRILVGVSGGIAAYKSPVLVRRLIERGCEVRVVMTRAATEFITPLTLQAVSGHPVHQHLLDAEAESGMGHIELARWAEQVVIAPASANLIAKLAHGRADDLLSTLALATESEVVVAPAMNRRMWAHPATQRNLETLAQRGVRVIGPDTGDQACGESGAGRMTEPEEIAEALAGAGHPRLLDDVHVLITAGPTWEAMDPVRGITNHSSGKMGYAMAQAALDFGARVTLVSGTVNLQTPPGARRINVVSAQQMMDAVASVAADADLFIAVAAVADYRPAEVAAHKIKKKDERMRVELIRNPDILASVAAMKNAPFTVGFAAETRDVIANARKKMKDKGVDVMAANEVVVGVGDGAGNNANDNADDNADDNATDNVDDNATDNVFGSDENSVTLIYKTAQQGSEVSLAKTDKYRLAVQIIENIAPFYMRWRKGRAER